METVDMREFIVKAEEFGVDPGYFTATELIRCKDCKWKHGSECVRFAEVRPFPDDFCSRAERNME